MRSSQTGQLLRVTAERFRLELGIPSQLGLTPYKPFASYVTDCWYKTTIWKLAAEYPIQIHEDYPNVSIMREGDQFLMHAFVDNGF